MSIITQSEVEALDDFIDLAHDLMGPGDYDCIEEFGLDKYNLVIKLLKKLKEELL